MPARKPVILCYENDPQALRLLTRSLYSEGFEVSPVGDEEQLFETLEIREPDLVLLGASASSFHDFQLCRQVRYFSLVPIIVMSTHTNALDKAQALEAGADNFLTKPVSVIELFAQVRAILRRIQWSSNEQMPNLCSILTFGNLTVDYVQNRITRDGHPVALTPIEYRILSYLALNADRVVTHNLLVEHVWGSEYIGESHVLKVHINRLRHKIELDPRRPVYIITKTGLGYLFSAQPGIYLPKESGALDMSSSKYLVPEIGKRGSRRGRG